MISSQLIVTDRRQKRSVLGGGKRQKSDAPSPFDGRGEQSLMTRAIAGNPTWGHFSPLCDELPYGSGIFVVDF
jgi:hypothetical protein